MLDFVGMALSLIATYFSIKVDVRAWPFSLLAIIVNTYLYWNNGLFGQGILEMLYTVSILYGWWLWNKPYHSKPIQNISLTYLTILGMFAPMAIYLMSFIIFQKTLSEIAFWDASVMVFSLIAQWLLCQKIIQCWILWLVVDLMVVFIHWHKGLPFHSFLHIIYLGMAIAGYLKWKKELIIHTTKEKSYLADMTQ